VAVTATWPAKVMLISPAQSQMHVHSLVSAGIPPTITLGQPGIQGADVIGTHGIGVSTPRAAAVALATSGLAMDIHIPKVGMFVIGTKSLMLPAGIPAALTICGVGMNAAGAAPNVQAIMAPETTMLMIKTSSTAA
jgi:hypothetical protein